MENPLNAYSSESTVKTAPQNVLVERHQSFNESVTSYNSDDSSSDDFEITNRVERTVNGNDIIEKVPVIFAFAVTTTDQSIFNEELLPPNVSEKNSKINWASPLDGQTVLQSASISGNLPLVKQLVIVGADLEKKNINGDTALHLAIATQKTEVAIFISGKLSKEELDQKNEKGESPLLLAVIMNNLEVMDKLLEKGADVNSANTNGTTALMFALKKNDPKQIEILLKYKPDTKLKDNNGRNCLHYYGQTEKYNIDTISFIRDIAKDKILVDSLDNQNHKPIHYAVEVGISEVVDHFLAMSSLKNVGVVYDEAETVCKTQARMRVLTGKSRVSVLVKTDNLGYEITSTPSKEKEDYLNSLERVEKWKTMISYYNEKQKMHKKMILRLYKGVPISVRQSLWRAMLHIEDMKKDDSDTFRTFASAKLGDEEDDQIHKDVTRAHQNNIKFKCKFSEGQKKLFLVLRALANRDKEVGYVQGEADLYGFFVLVFEKEEDMFWAGVATFECEKFGLRQMLLRNFPGVKKFIGLEMLVMKKYHKEIYEIVKKLGGYDTLYPHFLEFYALWFCRVFNGDLSMWVLDLVMVEGWQITLSVASAIFWLAKDEVLKTERDLMSIDLILKNPVGKIAGFEKFAFVKLVFKLRIPPSQVDGWIVKYNI
ncbi:hypothetical protein EIN_207540 [Entamoeba invadens IP1]|uniref:Rab-GAP TBC domain-containing protein n=1 Tax=Entamoeba invadens IP1 TaxID=370355 RepID=A0A0A1U9J6_ENTIV|nr:hypothetical protein EIN_207540 [Entamoeba invadens IP1]ELP91687.1 hypothetical protein EIN_207540 [Entamoeba invadens IP1]|eukprot:XP_004258458.1 hypothetical protein EIN_207540 [Entamoeba invadens IP1]